MAGRPTRRKRHCGSVEELPSGKFRVRVYSGVDPLTGREHYLREIVDTSAEAERSRRPSGGISSPSTTTTTTTTTTPRALPSSRPTPRPSGS
jgi:hypothetical protein